jgi:hypothetical protein
MSQALKTQLASNQTMSFTEFQKLLVTYLNSVRPLLNPKNVSNRTTTTELQFVLNLNNPDVAEAVRRLTVPLADNKVQNEGGFLPTTTGEALTLTPLDMPDVDCVVQQWKADWPNPVLTLLCPPGQVFAPLRVLIKLSWMKPEDAPVNPIDILALPGAATKIRTCKTAALVWLQVRKKEGGQPQSVWVSFNGVVDVALLGGQSRRHPS